jgi:hypothetical protein
MAEQASEILFNMMSKVVAPIINKKCHEKYVLGQPHECTRCFA